MWVNLPPAVPRLSRFAQSRNVVTDETGAPFRTNADHPLVDPRRVDDGRLAPGTVVSVAASAAAAATSAATAAAALAAALPTEIWPE
jgi:hypothetical protein